MHEFAGWVCVLFICTFPLRRGRSFGGGGGTTSISAGFASILGANTSDSKLSFGLGRAALGLRCIEGITAGSDLVVIMAGRLSLWLLLCPCEIEPLRSRDRLLFRLRLGRRTALVKVFDLRGTSVMPLAAYVCEGSSSGSRDVGAK